MRPPPRAWPRRALGFSLLLLALTAGPTSVGAQSASYPDPAGYCLPGSAQFDPGDLGSAPLDPLPSGIGERLVDLAGVETPLLESGPVGDSTAAVFVHGNPGSSRDFVALMAAARPLGLRMVAFDLPGFGRAGRPWSFPYTGEGYLRWFASALEQLGIRHAILVVHDLGGPLAMQWAAGHPNAFVAAAIIDSGVLVGYQDHYLARTWKTPIAGEAFMASTTHTTFDTGVQNGQQRPLPQGFVDRMYAEYDRPTRCAILSVYRSVPDVDAMARAQAAALAPLNRPALVVWGAHDPYLPTQLAYAQRAAFPSADVHVLDDAAHWPFIDDPGAVGSLLTSFLGRWAVRPSPAARRPTLTLTVSPRQAIVGRRARFRFTVGTAAAGRRVTIAGATIRFGGRMQRTGRRGVAALTITFRRPGRYRATATKPGHTRAQTIIRVQHRRCPELRALGCRLAMSAAPRSCGPFSAGRCGSRRRG